MRQETPLTDEEVSQHRNFDRLLKNYGRARATRTHRRIAWYGAAVTGLLVLAFVGYRLAQTPAPKPTASPVGSTMPKPVPEVGLSPVPRTSAPAYSPGAPAGKKATTASPGSPAARKKTTAAKPAKKSFPDSERAAAPRVPQPETTPPSVSFRKAEPVDGYPALYEYFRDALQYPELAKRDSVTGAVLVSFAINRSGEAEGIEVVKSLRADLDQEAIRLVEQMPRWKPALLNGKPITTRLALPLTFQLSAPKQ